MTAVASVALAGVVLLAAVGMLAVGRVRDSLRNLRSENAALRHEVSEVRVRLMETRQAAAQEERNLQRHKERFEKQSGRIRKLREDLTGDLGEAKEQLAQRTAVTDDLGRRLAISEVEIAKMKSGAATVRAEAQKRNQSQDRINVELRTEAMHVSRLSGAQIHGSVRILTSEALGDLLRIAEELGLSWVTESQIRYMEHAVVALEGRVRGRLAAPVEAMILRALVVMASPSTDVKVLEIGTLHGLSACYLHEVAKPQMTSFHQTIVDPFLGYYEAGRPDLFTPIPITRDVAVENLARVGATEADYEIVVGMSEAPEVLEHLKNHRFDVIVIDGDHSYDGVRRDFENYADQVVRGGFLIIDDYRGPSWPDVTRYVDETVFTDRRFEFVTGDLRTAVVVRKP